jgi:cyclic pyranopterin phosphate synthase
VDIIKDIRSYQEINSIAMTTNGLVLKHKLKYLKDAGLDNLNISLDTFIESKFTLLTRRLGFEKVLEVLIILFSQ